MKSFKSRSEETELMDDLNCNGQVVNQTLMELDVINRKLGGNYVSIIGLKSLLKNHNKAKEVTVLDLGCGGGDILIYMAKWAKKEGYKMKFIGIDANPNIIRYAEQHCSAYSEISFQAIDIFGEQFSKLSCDIVHSSLFTHHFHDGDLVRIFSGLKNQTRIGMIVNDLHRHWLAYYSIKLITRFFSKSEMVRNDAAVSVARGFKKKDIIKILNDCDFSSYSVVWKWAFRWKVLVDYRK